MALLRALLAVVVGLVLLAAPTPARAVDSLLTDDAYVSAGARTTNYGSASTLLIQGGSQKASSYLQFDLSTLPSGTKGGDVARASLWLWVAQVAAGGTFDVLSLIHISEPTRHLRISYAVFCL